MRYLLSISIFAFAISAFASQSPSAPVSKAFEKNVQKYVTLEKEVESALPAAVTTKDVGQIDGHQHELALRITEARHDAKQGDIFTHDVREEFEKIIRNAFKGRDGRVMRATLHEDGPVKPLVLRVNQVYPEDIQRITTPPTLLMRLPALPKDLAYRIIGNTLVLQDLKTNLIVDFIPKVIP